MSPLDKTKGKHIIFLLKICVRMNTSLKISTRSLRTKKKILLKKLTWKETNEKKK